MISIFGSLPSNAPTEAVQTQAATSAVSRTPAPSPRPVPKFGWKWFTIGRAKKRLQMVESVSLGEKRFVALVQVDGRQFLIGGAPSNVGMLAELAPEETFHQVLKDATQGLDIPVPSVATVEPTRRAVSEPAVTAQLPAVPFEAHVVAKTEISSSSAKIAPAETPQAVPAVVSAGSAPVPSPEPVDPIEPIDPVDLAFDAPVSFSPSLLAAMQARQSVSELPMPKVNAAASTPMTQARTVVPEVVQDTIKERATEEKVVEQEKAAEERVALLTAAPRFTFQVSPFFYPNVKRVALAWNFQGATS